MGRYIDEDDFNETFANQVVPEERISESGSINNELEDGEIVDYDSTDPDIPDLVDDDEEENDDDEDDEEEEIFAIDYDTTENTRNASNWVTRSPYNGIENSIIHSYSENSLNSDFTITTTGISFNIGIPQIGSFGIQTPLYQEQEDNEDEEEEEEEDEEDGYDSF